MLDNRLAAPLARLGNGAANTETCLTNDYGVRGIFGSFVTFGMSGSFGCLGDLKNSEFLDALGGAECFCFFVKLLLIECSLTLVLSYFFFSSSTTS